METAVKAKRTIKMPEKETSWLGHPQGLFYLFFAELWERFSFYGMRALLILYMTKHLLYSDEDSFGIYAAYGSLVYVTPFIGGILADKFIGYRKSVILGGILMALGHFILAIENELCFFGALGLIIVGNGFFKPNISSLVGTLYPKGSEKIESGFTIFYMGINVGSMAAPLLCGWIGASFGWHYGFGLAGVGMLIGLVTFSGGLKKNVLGNSGLVPDKALYNKKVGGLNKGQLIVLLSLIAAPCFAMVVKFHHFEHYLVWVVSFVIIGALIAIMASVSKMERQRLFVVVYFTVLMSLFWTIFEQAGSSLTLFADRNVDLIGMNAAQTNSINGAFVILMAIPFALIWPILTRIGKNPNSPIKFGTGLILLGLGFLIFALSANGVNEMAKTPMVYLVLGYMVLTAGEMFLSPIGLSKVTELTPIKYLAFAMGIWFSANFYGHFFAGQIAKLTTSEGDGPFSGVLFKGIIEQIIGFSKESISGLGPDFNQLYSYVSVFAGFGLITIFVGVLAILVSPVLKRMMHGIR